MVFLAIFFFLISTKVLAETSEPPMQELQELQQINSTLNDIKMDTNDIVNTLNKLPVIYNFKIVWVKDTEAYIVWQASGAEEYYIYLNDELYGATDIAEKVISELEPESEYSVYVEAVNLNGSTTSDIVTFKTLPPTPSQLKNVDVYVTENSINLYWDASPEDEKVLKYNIYLNSTKIDETGNNFYTVNDLAPGRYNVEIRAENEYREGPGYSVQVEIKALDTPKLIATNVGKDRVIIAWDNVDDATKYKIFINDEYITTTTETQYELRISGSYKIKVIAEDEYGNQSEPAEIEVNIKEKAERINFGNVLQGVREYVHYSANMMIVLFCIGGALAIIRAARIPFGRWRL